MLVLGSRFHDTPIMSLQTGTRLASTTRDIVDPRNLTVVAYEVDGQLLSERPSFLRINEIREISPLGMIIDGNDELVGLDDVIKIKKLVEMNFELVGMHVIDEHRHKLGKVEDYTLDTKSFVIQQLHVKRGVLHSLTDTGLLINRSQIVEINDHEIIVKSTNNRQRAEPVSEATRNEYVNPFRQPKPQAEPSATNN